MIGDDHPTTPGLPEQKIVMTTHIADASLEMPFADYIIVTAGKFFDMQ
jgi:hypothetical protein